MRSIADTIDVFFFTTTNRQNPAALVIDTANRFLYTVLEQTIYSFYYPSSSIPPLVTWPLALICVTAACPLDCKYALGQGHCVAGVCNCTEGWIGSSCSERACSSDCGASDGRGVCGNGVCYCSDIWTGANCTDRRCSNDCNNRGTCDTAANYTCNCEDVWTGEACSTPQMRQPGLSFLHLGLIGFLFDLAIPTFLVCNASASTESCVNVVGCGWCGDGEGDCRAGNLNGPSEGSCHEWLVTHDRELGTVVVAIIFIIIFAFMLVNNFLSAMVVDYQTATLVNQVNPLTVEFLKATYWRDERSSKSWVCKSLSPPHH